MNDQSKRENLLNKEMDEVKDADLKDHLQIPAHRMVLRNSTVSRMSMQNFIENFPNDEKEFTNKEIFSTVHDIVWSSIGIDSKMRFIEKSRLIIKSDKYHASLIGLVVVDCICVILQVVLEILFKESKNKKLYQAEKIVEILSLFVLSLFLLSIFLHLILVPKSFFKSKLEIFDSIIVLISFGLEVFSVLKKESVREIEAAVITFRFWRIIRIVNAIVITVEKRVFKKLDSLKKDIKCLLDENKQMEEEIELKKLEIGDLKLALEKKNHQYEDVRSMLDKIQFEKKLQKSLDEMASLEINKLMTENADLKLKIKILNREMKQLKSQD